MNDLKRKIHKSEHSVGAFQNQGYKCLDCNSWCNENYNTKYVETWRIKEDEYNG